MTKSSRRFLRDCSPAERTALKEIVAMTDDVNDNVETWLKLKNDFACEFALLRAKFLELSTPVNVKITRLDVDLDKKWDAFWDKVAKSYDGDVSDVVVDCDDFKFYEVDDTCDEEVAEQPEKFKKNTRLFHSEEDDDWFQRLIGDYPGEDIEDNE